MLVLKFVVARTVLKFTLEPVQDHNLILLNNVVIHAINGVPIILKERE